MQLIALIGTLLRSSPRTKSESPVSKFFSSFYIGRKLSISWPLFTPGLPVLCLADFWGFALAGNCQLLWLFAQGSCFWDASWFWNYFPRDF